MPPPDGTQRVCEFHPDLMGMLGRIEVKVDSVLDNQSALRHDLDIHVERHKERELGDEKVGRLVQTYEQKFSDLQKEQLQREQKYKQEQRQAAFNWPSIFREVLVALIKWGSVVGVLFCILLLARNSDLVMKALGFK